MDFTIVHTPPKLGAKAIILALLKALGLAAFLIAIFAFPAFGQQPAVNTVPTMVSVRMPVLRVSNPVAIMQLENARAARDTTGTTLYFDLGSSVIRSEAAAELDASLEMLRANPTLRIRIEGRADDGASNADNTSLAWTRAGATKLWLTSQGIASDRIDAVGFNAARPVCQESLDICQAKGLRAEFLIVAGTGDAAPNK
ncbi:MAG TPA: OmpA family protein [Gemmatimonadaceae bacterium]|nr:OmpA family protein [Gemmatimonadaceae bacterium]